MKKINIIIFSKDRPSQLLACLKSLAKQFSDIQMADISILFKATNLDFKKGYLKTLDLTKNIPINWVPEVNFESQTKDLINPANTFTMFLVDDIVFVNKFSLSDKQITALQSNAVLAASLRLHLGITSCYATGQDTKIPNLVKGYVWDWRAAEGDWGYPMSVDGNIYKTDLLNQIINQIHFTNPNTFEASLDSIKYSKGLQTMLSCYDDAPRLINIPANRVQEQFKNKFANGITPTELNENFLSGYEIDFAKYENKPFNTCHVPIDLIFKEIENV